MPDPVSISIWTGGGFLTGILAAIGWLDKNYARRELVTETFRKVDAEIAEIKSVAKASADRLDRYHQQSQDKLGALSVGQARMETTLETLGRSVDGQFAKLLRLSSQLAGTLPAANPDD